MCIKFYFGCRLGCAWNAGRQFGYVLTTIQITREDRWPLSSVRYRLYVVLISWKRRLPIKRYHGYRLHAGWSHLPISNPVRTEGPRHRWQLANKSVNRNPNAKLYEPNKYVFGFTSSYKFMSTRDEKNDSKRLNQIILINSLNCPRFVFRINWIAKSTD